MTLTVRKLTRIRTTVLKTFAGRAQPVVLTMRVADGTTTQRTVSAIWRHQIDGDPTLEGAGNNPTHIGVQTEIFAIFNQLDITLQQLRATIYAQLPPATPGTQLGSKHVLVDVEPVGIPLGGDRFFTRWTRQG